MYPDFGALASALHEATRGGGEGAEKSGKRMRRIGRNHYALDGFETRQKGRAIVIGIDVDGETVATKDVKIADGKFVRCRRRRA